MQTNNFAFSSVSRFSIRRCSLSLSLSFLCLAKTQARARALVDTYFSLFLVHLSRQFGIVLVLFFEQLANANSSTTKDTLLVLFLSFFLSFLLSFCLFCVKQTLSSCPDGSVGQRSFRDSSCRLVQTQADFSKRRPIVTRPRETTFDKRTETIIAQR
jgi:hypothetical protein